MEGGAKRGYSTFQSRAFSIGGEKTHCRFIVLCYFFPFCCFSSASSQNSPLSSVGRSTALFFVCLLFSNNTRDNSVIGETNQNDSTQTIHDSSRVQALHSQNSPEVMVSMWFSVVVSSLCAVCSLPCRVLHCQVLIA